MSLISVLFITNLYNRPLLPLQKNTGSSNATLSQQQQNQQPSGASALPHLPPAKKEKPLGKGTANIAMKSNSAYDQWSREEDGLSPSGTAPTHKQNPSGRSYAGGGRGTENLYRF